jgi:thiamine-phosphate pyrophosphorylase
VSALNNSPRADRREAFRRVIFHRPVLCYVTDRRSLPAGTVAADDPFAPILQRIDVYAAAGIDWIQIREKDLDEQQCSSLTSRAMDSAYSHYRKRESLTAVVVNHHVSVAITAQAFGVHLTEKSVTVADAIETAAAYGRKDLWVGKSCHSLEGAQAAEREGAYYLFFGPVFSTPSKASFGPAQGLDRLAEVCRSVPIPVLAIGGVTLENIPDCLASGASGIAAIRLFQDAPDPAATIRALRQLGR